MALKPPPLDLASQITPSLTPEASKSDKQFKSYAIFKDFKENQKYFLKSKKSLKMA